MQLSTMLEISVDSLQIPTIYRSFTGENSSDLSIRYSLIDSVSIKGGNTRIYSIRCTPRTVTGEHVNFENPEEFPMNPHP